MSRSDNQWLQFYENNQPTTLQSWSGDPATVVTTTTTTVSNPVTRPTNTRRRSRASRRTPTTLLHTDTTNFRAMVQRFTGGGNTTGDVTPAPFLSNDHSSITSTHQLLSTYNTNNTYSFGDGHNGVGSSSSGMAVRPNDGYFRQPHGQPYFTMTVEDGGSTTANDGDDQHMGFRQSGSYNW